MSETRKWVAGATVAALLLLIGGWTLLVGPKRGEAAVLREQVAAQEASTLQLKMQLQVLREKAAALPEQEAVLAEVGRLLPTSAALPELVRALTEASRSAGVELVSVAPGTLAPVSAPDPAAAAAPPAAPTDPAAASAAPAQAGAPGALSALPMTLNVNGGFYELEQFVADLEELPRALRVTGLTLSSGAATTEGVSAKGTGLALKLTAEVYVAAPVEAASPPAAPSVTGPTGAAPAGAEPTGAEPTGAVPAPEGAATISQTES